MKILFILILFISSNSYAIQCEWWQTKYSATTVNKHPKKGKVREHPRREYCASRWPNADLHIKQFRDDPIHGWSNKGENFKKWNRSEIQIVLELLPKLPQWAKINQYTFLRADKSIHHGNSATSELTKKAIILYDTFFTYSDKLGAIGHEASHFIFKELTDLEITEFEKLSGWRLETKDRKVYVVPPNNPLMPDSVIDNEEDFTNHAEMYISNPEKLKKISPKLFEFFLKRFPK